MWIDLQAVATHLATAAESLSRRLRQKLSAVVYHWRGGGGLFASAVCQKVVFRTWRTPMVTQFTSTVNADYFVLVERTVWQGFEGHTFVCTQFHSRTISRSHISLEPHFFLEPAALSLKKIHRAQCQQLFFLLNGQLLSRVSASTSNSPLSCFSGGEISKRLIS